MLPRLAGRIFGGPSPTTEETSRLYPTHTSASSSPPSDPLLPSSSSSPSSSSQRGANTRTETLSLQGFSSYGSTLTTPSTTTTAGNTATTPLLGAVLSREEQQQHHHHHHHASYTDEEEEENQQGEDAEQVPQDHNDDDENENENESDAASEIVFNRQGQEEDDEDDIDDIQDEDEEDAEQQQAQEQQQQEEEAVEEEEEEEEAIAVLTRRLRCLFAVITWPVVPLGTLVTLTLVWLLYAAFILDVGDYCSHPLHWYAVSSLVLVSYIPYHAKIRSLLFNYVRERDGYNRPLAVRRYDQCFHTLALLYVYGGITLVQACRDDLDVQLLNMGMESAGATSAEAAVTDAGSGSDPSSPTATSTTTTMTIPFTGNMNTCAATCPHLYQALTVYVAMVELFTFSLILPLLFLPCIYLWFLRQATADAEALAVLQERLREEEFLFRNGGVTTDEILNQLEAVKLVSIASPASPLLNCDNSSNATATAATTLSTTRVVAVPVDSTDFSKAKDVNGTKSCCICMSDFRIFESTPDVESGKVSSLLVSSSSTTTMTSSSTTDHEESNNSNSNSNNHANSSNNNNIDDNDDDDSESIVRTLSCGHLFHKHCIGSWVGGRWQTPHSTTGSSSSSSPASPRRRARRTTCPLCRKDLRPHSS